MSDTRPYHSVMSGEYHPTRRQDPETSCCGYPTSPKCSDSISTLLSTIGILFLVLSYTLLGALTFMSLESKPLHYNKEPHIEVSTKPTTPNKTISVSTSIPKSQPSPTQPPLTNNYHDEKLRTLTVEKLWKITEDLNILYKENWTKLAEKEMIKFENDLIKKYSLYSGGGDDGAGPHIWNFSNSFLYSLTLITTIGYGNISAKTLWGRITTIIYTLIGIPLMLIYLSIIGETLANNFRRIYSKLTKQNKTSKPTPLPNVYAQYNHINDISANKYDTKPRNRDGYCTHMYGFEPKVRIPIFISFLMIISFILIGSLIFNKLENWTLLDGTFFCFTSLGTIGFGELIPGNNHTKTSRNISVLVSSSYILIGMAVISMCFNLIQEELIYVIKKFTFKINNKNKNSVGGGACTKTCDIS